jgi:hypothetical protein
VNPGWNVATSATSTEAMDAMWASIFLTIRPPARCRARRRERSRRQARAQAQV